VRAAASIAGGFESFALEEDGGGMSDLRVGADVRRRVLLGLNFGGDEGLDASEDSLEFEAFLLSRDLLRAWLLEGPKFSTSLSYEELLENPASMSISVLNAKVRSVFNYNFKVNDEHQLLLSR